MEEYIIEITNGITKHISFNFNDVDWLFIIIVLVLMILSHQISHIIIKKVNNFFALNRHTSHSLLEKRVRTFSTLLSNIITIVIYSIGSILILSELGIDILPLIAGAGIIGLALAFGSQTLVKDFVTGFIILTENHVNVGDWVEIDKCQGKIKSLEIRVTTLEDIDGNLIIIPNNSIGTIKLLNKSRLSEPR